jgi:allantoicase
MLFVAEVAQIILRHMGMRGVDTSQFRSDLAFSGIPLEQRVNAGYRELVFAAFAADLPEEIDAHGPRDPLANFNHVVGARVEAVSNQRFARAENLLSPYLPTFDPKLFGRQGKIMDSWETVRHNPEPFDWMIFEMQRATAVSCVAVSTQFHLGNHAEALEIDGWDAARGEWQAIVAPMQLFGHGAHAVESVSGVAQFQRIRVRMYPDGGVTRLALYGNDLPAVEKERMFSPAIRAWHAFDPQTKKPMTPKYTTTAAEVAASNARVGSGMADLASAAFGGQVVSASNEHYSPATQVISPYPPLSMVDGLESARSREPGHSENVVIRLGQPAKIGRIELDFSHFVNNNPREVEIDGLRGTEWVPLVARTEVKAFAGNVIAFAAGGVGPCEQIRVTVFPDGGMNRVRVFAAP